MMTSESSVPLTPSPEAQTFRFFTFDVTPQVFHHTALSFAFVNNRPLLPGHVLVSPIRHVVRLSDLTDAEVADLFVTVKRVGKMLTRVYAAPALTIPLQDGVEAGQTVPHLHVHVIPRPESTTNEGSGQGQGGLDEIYARLEGKEGDVGAYLAWRTTNGHGLTQNAAGGVLPDLESIPLRSIEDMINEAKMLTDEMEER